MVILKHDVRKEMTYGWYPPTHNIYDRYKDAQNYEKECMFKYEDSLFHHSGHQLVFTPQPPSSHSQRFTPRSAPPRSPHRAASNYQPRTPSARGLNLSIDGKSVLQPAFSGLHQPGDAIGGANVEGTTMFKSFRPSPKLLSRPPSTNRPGSYRIRSRPPSVKPKTPTAFVDRLVQMEPSSPLPAPRLFAGETNDESDLQQILKELQLDQVTKPDQTSKPADNIDYSERAQSAKLVRQSSAVFSRRVKSAGHTARSSVKARPTSAVSCRQDSPANDRPLSAVFKQQHSEEKTIGETIEDVLLVEEKEDKTKAYKQALEELNEELEKEKQARTAEILPTPAPYEKLQDQYGWYVEVPGDPLNIKQIPQRLPYTVECKIPVVPEDPPKMKIQDNRTFFSNTIPRKPATFTIHPEWASETFNARKNAHLKVTGKKYHTRNFGFVY